MPPIKKPSVRLLYLAGQLKELRKKAGRSVKDVIDALGISAPVFSRIEAAAVTIPPARVEQLLELYGVPVAKRAELMQVAREASKHGLWQGGSDIWTSGYVNLEADADEIFLFEPAYAPGLFQTAEYYRALLAGHFEATEIDRRVAGRMGRQALLTRANPPALHVVIGESVIRQMIGGPEVMKQQILALWEASQRENVTLQVATFAAGNHPGLDGCFTILTYDAYDMQLGYTEGPGGHIYLESAAALKGINVRKEGVVKVALSPSESASFLREAADSIV